MPSFELSDSQKMIRDFAHDFAEREIRPIAARCDLMEEMPWEIFRKLKALSKSMDVMGGRPGGGSKKESRPGGARLPRGINMLVALVVEEFAWGCVGITCALTFGFLAAGPILLLGTPEQRKKFFSYLDEDDPDGRVRITALCMTEPEAGSDISNIQTTAVRDGDCWVLNGTKRFISNGISASVYVVWAKLREEGKGKEATRAFVVLKGTPGLRPDKPVEKLGIRASETSDVILENCRIPLDHLLGSRETGYKTAKGIFDLSRPTISAMAVGLARAVYEYLVDYSKTAPPGSDDPPGGQQSIAFRLAEMATEIEAARLLTWKACAQADEGIPNAEIASMSKICAPQVAMRAAADAIDIVGPEATRAGHPLEKWFRDAKILDIFEGTGNIQRRIVAREILGFHSDGKRGRKEVGS